MKIRKAVITAAGKGTRQYPATQAVQKEMIPLVDRDGFTKPTLQIIIEEALASGIEEIAVIASPEDVDTFRAYFQAMPEDMRARFAGKEWGLEISDRLADIGRRLTVIPQPTAEGYGHAVWCAKDWVGNEPCLLLLGDHIYISRTEQPAIRQVLDVAESHGQTVYAVERSPEADLYRYGTLAARPMEAPGRYEVTRVIEKPSVEAARAHLRIPGFPEGEYMTFFGIQALTPQIFDCLDELVRTDTRERGEIQFATAQGMLAERAPVLACEINADLYDMGVPLGLLKTQIALGMAGVFRDDIQPILDGLRPRV
jgi:UTP--glucose-1-phosphate uridylyltransferase